MKRYNYKTNILYKLNLVILITMFSCKTDFLDEKPNSSIVVPQNLADIAAFLDNTSEVNKTGGLGQMGADEYDFVDYAAWQSTFTAMERNSFIWANDIYEGYSPVQDWAAPFWSVYYANNALESLKNLDLPESTEANNVKGWALFVRAYAYHDLVRNFCLAYDSKTAETDLGLPIRLEPRVDQLQPRSNLKKTYEQIIIDLQNSATLLASNFQETNRNRPSKTAAYALLARVYLMMNDFENAETNTDKALSLYNKLIDYNTISTSDPIPFKRDNDETIFSASQFGVHGITFTDRGNTATIINPLIINSYRKNDLRLLVYFERKDNGRYSKKVGYNGNGVDPFHGLAVDELYLIKAECLARKGENVLSLKWLNDLLIKRFKNTEVFVPVTAHSTDELLDIILNERIKELIWRGIRWSDIKRLNKIGKEIVLKRILNGKEYILPPNDVRYAFPIPEEEISLSKVEQNPR